MRTLDAASALLSRLQELAVLAGNDTNTDADLKAIDAEAEAIADEFHRLLSTAKYKGKDLFVSTANSEYLSVGGRDAERRSVACPPRSQPLDLVTQRGGAQKNLDRDLSARHPGLCGVFPF